MTVFDPASEAAYFGSVWSLSTPRVVKLEEAFRRACLHPSGSEVICPFCGEGDFDLPGLKHHLRTGFCQKWDEVEVLA